MTFPTCLQLLDVTPLLINEQFKIQGGENVIACVGTKEGLVQIHKITSVNSEMIVSTRGGMSFGAVTAIDINVQNEKMVATN